MDRKLLTVAIPSYNREKDLEINLRGLLPHAWEYKDLVDVLVSDNASEDGTPELVQSFQEQYPGILRYYRQEKGTTALSNFYFCAEHSESDYIILLGDDDLLVPYFFATIISLIRDNPEIAWIHFNYWTTGSSEELIGCNLRFPNIDLPFITFYERGGDMLKDKISSSSFMSANVFKKEVWDSGIETARNENYPGYNWYNVLLTGAICCKSIYYSLPLVIARSSSNGGYSTRNLLYAIYGLGALFKKMDAYSPGLYDVWADFRQTSKRLELRQRISSVGADKLLYKENRDNILNHLKYRSDRLYYDLCCYVLPGWFCLKIMRPFYRLLEIVSRVANKER